MSVEEQMRLGVKLGHEAYRDGVVDGNNEAETVAAVKGHTEMAARMIQDGHTSFVDEIIRKDLEAYVKAGSNFAEYVKANYDSSADYWKLFTFSDGSHILVDDGKKDLTIMYMRENEDEEWSVFDTQVLKMEGSSSVAQSLYRIMGKERVADLLKDAPVSDKHILEDASHPKYEEKIGEYLMRTTGPLYLTDGLVDGYITTNLKKDGTVDKFTVSATLLRMPESWDSKQGYGIPVTVENKKARDTLIFTKKDLNGNLLDTITLSGVQSVDVYNTKDYSNEKIDRNQPYNAPFVDYTIQGNTIASNFSLQLDRPGSNSPMLIQNTKTIAGYLVDSAGVYNKNADQGGAWRIHWTGTDPKDGNRTSDGCIIPSIADVKRMSATLARWGLEKNDHIYGTLIDPRAGVNRSLWQQYQ
jgi:hypothetical protein